MSVSLTPKDRKRIERAARAAGLDATQVARLLDALRERLCQFAFFRAQPRDTSEGLRRDLASIRGAADKLRGLLFRELSVLPGQPSTPVVREVYALLRAHGLPGQAVVSDMLSLLASSAKRAKEAMPKGRGGSPGSNLEPIVESVMYLAYEFRATGFQMNKAGELFCLLVEILDDGNPSDAVLIQRRIRAIRLPKHMR